MILLGVLTISAENLPSREAVRKVKNGSTINVPATVIGTSNKNSLI